MATYTRTSADVSAGDDALAADYNALRTDLETLLTSLFGAPTTGVWDIDTISLDNISEQTLNHGVIIDGVTLKDGGVTATNFTVNTSFKSNSIAENTPDAGVTIDGVVAKDGSVVATNLTANTGISANAISEKTSGNGVSIDGVLAKDGGVSGAGNASFASIIAAVSMIVDGITLTNGGSGLRLDANLDLNGNTIRGLNKTVDFLTGTLNHGATIPLPTGFDQADCQWMAAPRETTSGSDSWSIVGIRTTLSGRAVTVSSYRYQGGWYNSGNASYVILGMKNRVA